MMYHITHSHYIYFWKPAEEEKAYLPLTSRLMTFRAKSVVEMDYFASERQKWIKTAGSKIIVS
jgi:hypothetical protein